MNKLGFVSCSVGWGGLEMNVLKLANWLQERDWDITLFTNHDSRLYKESQKYSIDSFIINKHSKYFDFIEAYRFSKILKKQKIDKIFVFDNRDLDFISLTKHLFFHKLQVIYQQHMQIGTNKKDFLHTYRFSSIDYWISPLNLLKKEVTEKTHFNQEKIKVIPLGTEIEQYISPKYLKSEARKRLSISDNALLMGIIGRIDPKKGQLFLVQAIKELQERNLSIELFMIGEPTINDTESAKYYQEIKEFIAKNNFENKIHIRDFTSDTSLFYNAIDIFALASEGETYGMVTIEAMLSNLPIIATNAAGTPELLNYGEFGLLYEDKNLEEFCNKLSWMLYHPEELKDMAAKAKKYASKKYSHDTECKMIEQLLALRA